MSEECSPKPYFVMSEECEWYPQWSDLGSIPNTATGLGKNVSLVKTTGGGNGDVYREPKKT